MREVVAQPLRLGVERLRVHAAFGRESLEVLRERGRFGVPMRARNARVWPAHVVVAQLRSESHLVQVAVARQKKHAVRILLLEINDAPCEAQAPVEAIDEVAAVDEVRAFVRELKLRRSRLVAHRVGLRDPTVKVLEVALEVGDIVDHDVLIVAVAHHDP